MSEFKNLPSGWKVVRLGEIGKVINGLTYSPDNVSNNGLLVLRSSNINNNSIVLNNDDVYVKGISKFNKTLENDILICVRNGSKNLIGKSALITEKYKDLAFGAFMAIFRSNYNLFLIHIFKTNTFFKQVKNDLGATINSINNGNLLNFKIPLPPLDEQEKIAEILSTWDEAINLTINLIESKKQFKKALMQNLLTAKIRFPEFKNEWLIVKLEEASEIYQPQTISQSELTDSGFDVYGANGIIGKYSRYNHEFEQVVITCRGNTCGAVNFTKPKSWITGNAMVINLDNSTKAIKTFIYYLLSNTNFQYLISGSGQPQITSNIRYHKIKLPNLDEQQKIAEVLTACDDEINLLNSKLENLKKQKQGLMQKLLSGKVRVRV
ncbi:restriction endonuclease subunit S [Campylobacter concisus]|uniref:restriction endonuclease subunit S n=1 Tax=Campylobacter concisus TaxID=199 RepID=UPI00122C6573|nr:restriction endonuclease subunit S [Campylobacter concisus]